MNYESELPCVICNLRLPGMVTFHHIYTRKAYPEHSEKKWNLVPICLKHHNEVHMIGNASMAKRYSSYEAWLLRNNWEISSGKVFHENN